MINSSATPSSGPNGPIIPARRDGVTSLRVHAFLAILAALGLRLLFVFRFPGSAGDSDLYIQFARIWADHHVYGFLLDGRPVSTDLRMPGYPAFLAGVALLFGRSVRAILLSQAVLDTVTCFLTAGLAAALAPAGARRRVWVIGLWLAATCPFVANYTAVVLTEVLVTLLATAAIYFLVRGVAQAPIELNLRGGGKHRTPFALALLGSFFTGLATLVRPEMPLLMGVGVVVYASRAGRLLGTRKTMLFAAAMAGAFLVPLLPWAARNLITLRRIQFLAPRYTTMPDEYAPVGYYAWTATWLERYRDVYVSAWRIGEEPLNIDDLPSTAFDSPDEKARVSELFAEYNDSPNLEISPELDRQFADIARERTRSHPLRTYVFVPFERVLTIWFTPRTELMTIDGKFWPLREQWADSHANVIVTGSFALLGYVYIALAIAGIWWVLRTARVSTANGPPVGPNLWGIALLVGYFVVRTAFLTTVEAPEPRYVVSCYPGVLALISLLGVRRNQGL